MSGGAVVLGASYGALIGSRLVHAGVPVTLVGRREEVDAFTARGLTVAFPARGDRGPVESHLEVNGSDGLLRAVTPEEVDPGRHDLAFLAMQEPQYAAPEVVELLRRLGVAGTPCVSVMNMAPLPFLDRLPAIDTAHLEPAYHCADAWRLLDPDQVTLASPDPQAYRPDPSDPTRLQVTLASNLKVAPFARPVDQDLVASLAAAVDASTVAVGDRAVAPGVRLVARPSLHVPLAKWPMLVAGNLRCVTDGAPRPIRDAVWDDVEQTREVYDGVADVIRAVGATDDDVVPFDTYAAAARSLELPSSLARALHAGVRRVERVDLLVAGVAGQVGRVLPELDGIIRRIDGLTDPANR